MEENEMIKLEEYTEEELEELKRAMYQCLRENGFTEDSVVAFRIMKRLRFNTKNRDFIEEIKRRLDAGQTRFTVNECKTYPNSPYQRDITNPAAEVRRIMMNLGLVSTRRGVYEVVG